MKKHQHKTHQADIPHRDHPILERNKEHFGLIDPAAMLHSAASVIEQRGKERDSKGKERSMAAAVAAFNAIEGTALTERQGWAFMQTLKLVRAASTARNQRYNADDYLDGAAYAALAAESADKEHRAKTRADKAAA